MMAIILKILTYILFAIAVLAGGEESDTSAVAILQKIADRVHGVDHSGTLSIEKISRGKKTASQKMKFWVHFANETDSIISQTTIEILPGSRGEGQIFWQWQLADGRQRRWLYTPGSGKLREIARLRVGRMALFNLDELALSHADIHGMAHTVVAMDTGGGRIEIRSRTMKGYTLKVSGKRVAETHLWIDPVKNLILKSESFSAKGNLIRTVEVQATVEVGGMIWATDLKVTEARKKQTTRITLTGLTVGPGASPSIFIPSLP